MWSLLAMTPAVQMTRIDVGGNRAGTQTSYTAYGFSGQVRVLIEGINTTEGTGGAGFYFDYASLEEAFLGTSGQGAEMPNPGVQSQFIAKSGGNQFNGEYYLDWYNNSLQGSNIPDDVHRPRHPRAQQRDRRAITTRRSNAGGPIKKDKIWWFGTYRTQINAVAQPQFRFDQTFDTEAVERGRQGHLPDQPEEQADRLLPVGPEDAAEPAALRHLPLQRRRTRPTSRTRAAGSTRANGTARSATSCTSRRATATSATTSRSSRTGDEDYFCRDTGTAGR